MKKMGSNISQHIIIVFLVIGILITLNFLSLKAPQRWDMTDEKEFTLSDSTTNILNRLEDQLTIKLYFTKDLPPLLMPIKERIGDLINEIKANAKQSVLIEAVVPEINEETEQETLAMGIAPLELNIREKDKIELKKIFMGIALYYQDKREVIPIAVQTNTLEYQIDLAILKLTQKELPRIGILIGSERQQYSSIQKLIRQIGSPLTITSETRNLENKDLKLLLVIDPVELDRNFVKELDGLLAAGTNIIIFSGNVSVSDSLTAVPVLTGLDGWLAEKGVEISDKLLLDVVQNKHAIFNVGMRQVYVPYPFWVRTLQDNINREHPITAQLEDILFPWSNTLMFSGNENSSWKTDELVHSSTNSFLQPDDPPNANPNYVETMTELPTLANHPLSAILTNTENKDHGKIFVTATHHIIQDRIMSQAPANTVFLSNMLEYSSWGNHLIGVRSRGKTTRPLKKISPAAISTIKWSHMAGLPSLTVLLGLGGLFFQKRRREKTIKKISEKK